MTESSRPRPLASGFESSFTWRTGGKEKDSRLDAAVSGYVKVSLEEAASLIDFGSVYVQGRVERNPAKVLAGDEEITVSFPPYGTRRFYELDPARILFRDRFLLVYDKEAGIPSQQTPYDAYNNIYAALLRRLASEKVENPYAALHHRLDRETSGVMLFALDRDVNRKLGQAFQEKRAIKEYLAWVEGEPEKDAWMSDREIGKIGGKYAAVGKGKGKKAETSFRVLYREPGRFLVLAQPLTGRTHQIRIHLSAEGHPVLGDRMYGAKPQKRLFLHALRLSIRHPARRSNLIVEAPVPPEWRLPPGLQFPPAQPA